MQASQVVLDLTHTSSLDAGETASGATNGTRVDSNGDLVSGTTPRFDYKPSDSSALGLLSEGARTNLNTRSNALSTSPWVNTWGGGVTLTANQAAGPDGASSMWKGARVDSDGDGFSWPASSYLAVSTEYEVSYFIKQGDAAQFRQNWFQSGDYAYINITFTAGVPAISALVGLSNAKLEDWGDGLYRVSYQFTTNSSFGTGLHFVVLPSRSSGGTTYNYFGFFQFAAGNCRSSHIPTSGSSVTRTADSIVRSGTNFSDYWNAAAMSVAIKFDSPGVGTRTVWQSDDNTANERYCLYTTGTTLKLLIVDGGSTVADITIGTITAYQQHWVAFRLQANDVAASLDGAAVGTDTSVTLPTVDRRRLGASTVAGEELFGHIAREIWIDGALTDGELRFLSAHGVIPVFEIDPASIELTATNVGLYYNRYIALDPVSLELTATNVGLLYQRRLPLTPPAILLTTTAITFRFPAVTPASRRFTPVQSLVTDRRFTVAASLATARRFTVEE